MTEYVAVLQDLAQHCIYGDKLKEIMCDRLVCGISDDRLQRRLLAELELTFEKALKVSQAIKTASRDVQDLQLHPKMMDSSVSKAGTQLPVHNLKAAQTWQGKTTPLNFINEKCHACSKKGHLKKMCTAKGGREA